VLSLHVSVPVQATPSLQLRAVPVQTAAALHVSMAVQKRPSSQEAPVFGLNAVAERAGSQTWHGLLGLVVLGA
jgi:hypothetical protein